MGRAQIFGILALAAVVAALLMLKGKVASSGDTKAAVSDPGPTDITYRDTSVSGRKIRQPRGGGRAAGSAQGAAFDAATSPPAFMFGIRPVYFADSMSTYPHYMITGRVRAAEGDGIAGANVYVSSLHIADLEAREVIGHCTTADDGTFEVSVPRTAIAEIRARAAGFGDAAKVVAHDGPLPQDPIKDATYELVMNPVKSVTGRVVDAKGLAIAGAAVEPRAHGEGLIVSLLTPVISDDNGHFTIADISGDKLTLIARHEGYQPKQQAFATTSGPLEIMLNEGQVSVSGQVVESGTSEPVRNVSFKVISLANKRGSETAFLIPCSTDAEGRFRIENAPVGLLMFGQMGRWISEDRGFSKVTVEGVDVEGVEIVVRPRRTLKGRVVDVSTSDPIGAAVVRLAAFDSFEEKVTGADGKFEFDLYALEPQDTKAGPMVQGVLGVQAPGYIPVSTEGRARGDKTPFIGPVEELVIEQDFPMAPVAYVEGQVLHHHGAPAGNALVAASLPRGRLGGSDEVRTDDAGNFKLRIASPSRQVVVRAVPVHKSEDVVSEPLDLEPGQRVQVLMRQKPPAEAAPASGVTDGAQAGDGMMSEPQ